MSYTEEVYERVVAQNPGEPEFHQAVKEVLDSLKVVIDKNEEEYRSMKKRRVKVFLWIDLITHQLVYLIPELED